MAGGKYEYYRSRAMVNRCATAQLGTLNLPSYNLKWNLPFEIRKVSGYGLAGQLTIFMNETEKAPLSSLSLLVVSIFMKFVSES